METVTLSEARVYVGTYNKYNSGALFGKWLDLSDYSDTVSYTHLTLPTTERV